MLITTWVCRLLEYPAKVILLERREMGILWQLGNSNRGHVLLLIALCF